MDFKLLDVVTLNRDIPEEGLTLGLRGTIVDIYKSPRIAYEVEFCDEDGETIGLSTLEPSDISLGS
jgi:hypothetical protein